MPGWRCSLGGRTFEAIEAVCNPGGELDVLAGVESLVEKSLVRQEEGTGDEPRFVMLETIHEYARERLEGSGEAEVLRQRHAEYFRQVAEAVEAEFGTMHQRRGDWRGLWPSRITCGRH